MTNAPSDLSFHQGTRISFGDFSDQGATYDVARYDAIVATGFSGQTTSINIAMPAEGFLVGSFDPGGISDLAGLNFTAVGGGGSPGGDSMARLGLTDLEAGEIGVSTNQTLDALLAAGTQDTGGDGLLLSASSADAFSFWDAPSDILSIDAFSDPGSATFAIASDATPIDPMTEAPVLTPELEAIIAAFDASALEGTKALDKNGKEVAPPIDELLLASGFVPQTPYRLMHRFIPGLTVPTLTRVKILTMSDVAHRFVTGHSPMEGTTLSSTGERRIESQSTLGNKTLLQSGSVPVATPLEAWASRSYLVILNQALIELGRTRGLSADDITMILTDNRASVLGGPVLMVDPTAVPIPGSILQQYSVWVNGDADKQKAFNSITRAELTSEMRRLIGEQGGQLLTEIGRGLGDIAGTALDTSVKLTSAAAAAALLLGGLPNFVKNLRFAP